jgi:hypothetical protein
MGMDKSKSNKTGTYIIIAVAVLLVGVGGFYSATLFQKMQGGTPTAAATNGGGMGRGGAGNGGFASRIGGGGIGDVTAVSDTSITITPRSRGGTATADKTYTINSSTNISDNGSTVTASDIAVGDKVLVTTSTDDTSTATAITVNPSFGGGGAQNQTDNSSSDPSSPAT